MTWRPPTYSTARLDSLVCPVLVDAGELRSRLPPRLSLPRFPDVPDGCHPAIVEIWRVQDGLIEFGGQTAHEWWELTGGAAGLAFGGSAGAALGVGIGSAVGAANGGAMAMWLGPVGWWCGAIGGATAGAAYGAMTVGTAGALYGAQAAADAGYRASENSSRVIGTYNEIIVTVPCQLAHEDGVLDAAFVLGTYTDSMASALGEWLIGWGYGKSLVLGGRATHEVLEVNAPSSGESFKAVTRLVPPTVPLSALRVTAPQTLRTLSLPLLGVMPANRLMISFLDRSFEARAVRVTPASVRLESSDAILSGLSTVSPDIVALGNGEPWGAFTINALPVRLSYPCAVDH
jgi:hypothetical protein